MQSDDFQQRTETGIVAVSVRVCLPANARLIHFFAGLMFTSVYPLRKVSGYTVCGSNVARVCILVDSIAWSRRPYFCWAPLLVSLVEIFMGMKAIAVCMPGARILHGDSLRMYLAAIADAKEEFERV